MSFYQNDLEVARLRAAVHANIDDARLWRWYADLMEDNRLVCIRTRKGWQLTVDERYTVESESFDCAVRTAARKWEDVVRAPLKLHRRKKTAGGSRSALLPTLFGVAS